MTDGRAAKTPPPEMVAYLQQREAGRVQAVHDTWNALTKREQKLVREAAVTGYILGMTNSGQENPPPDGRIVAPVLDICRANADLYPTLDAPRACTWIPGDAAPPCDWHPGCPRHGPEEDPV